MATAPSFPAQETGRQTSAGGASPATDRAASPQVPGHAWRLLAQIPEIAIQGSEHSAAPMSAAATEPVYRFDHAELPHPHAPAETVDARQPGANVAGPSHSERFPEASGLPLWAKPLEALVGERPITAPKGERSSATPAGLVARFLLLVALFTVAGLSIRLINTPRDQSQTTPIETPAPGPDRSAEASSPAVPTVPSVPLVESSAKPVAATPIEAESLPPHKISPSTVAVDQVPADRYADESSVTLVYPKTLYPAPTNLESLETDEAVARAPNQTSAVAQLPGYILEIPPHQAQHDHEQSNVH